MTAPASSAASWRGEPDPRRRVVLMLSLLSLLLHAPFTPWAGLLGLLSLLGRPEPPPSDLNAMTALPVSLLSQAELEQLGLGPAAHLVQAPERVGGAAPSGDGKPPALPDEDDDLAALLAEPTGRARRAASDAGASQPTGADAGGVDGAAGDAGTGDAGGGDAGTGDDGGPPSAEPLSLVAAATGLADPNANVKLLLLTERLRGLPIGARLGDVIRRLPQWSSFLGPAGIDPVRDVDRMYLAGPQFRHSAEVVAVIEHHLARSTVRKAVDGLVQRKPKGRWLSAPFPVARATADRSERLFALPRDGVVLMAPTALEADVRERGPSMTMPAMRVDAALVAFINKPWRVFIGVRSPVQLPESIESVMLTVTPSAAGGATVGIRATDATPEEAATHARTLANAVNLVTQRNLGWMGTLLMGESTLSLLEPLELHAEGRVIVGRAVATPVQVDRLLGLVEAAVVQLEQPVAPAPAPRAPAVPAPPRVGGAGGAGRPAAGAVPVPVPAPAPRSGSGTDPTPSGRPPSAPR